MASTIFGSFEFNFRKTEFFINRAYTLTAGQLKIQSQKEIGAMSARHQAEIVKAQQPVTKNLANKFEAGDAVADLKNALDRIVDIRNSLFEARAAAKLGERAGFDNALFDINRKAQDASQDSHNLIGWLAVDGNGVRSRTVELGPASFNIASRSLGATYAVELDDGERIRPEFRKNEMELNGQKFLVNELNYVSESDGAITFTVGEGEEQQTFTGTVKKGGLGIASSWVYGNFDSQEFQDLAVGDVNGALQRLNAAERELNASLIQAEYRYNKSKTLAEAAQTKVDNTVRAQLTEQQALNKAIEAKTKIALVVLSLGAQQKLTQIDAIFRPAPKPTNTILDRFGLFD
ncbi:hypothetical protein ACFOGJ_19315 [Marinibaculum pumilum]|uniref:Flagellin N-terminal domain-containing protein n=1 Tax=Marinibaculum pumilum TaxID=1766165 RepID=A0ABV7L410_9PROT